MFKRSIQLILTLLLINRDIIKANIYSIKNLNGGDTVFLGSNSEGIVQLYHNSEDNYGSENQLWTIEWIDDDWMVLKNLSTGKCLESLFIRVSTGSCSSKSLDSKKPAPLLTDQHWKWHNGAIQNRANGKVIETNDKIGLFLSTLNDDISQKWSFERIF